MDMGLIQKLSDEIVNNWEVENTDIRKRINGLLNRKSNRKLIIELSKSIMGGKFIDKNKAVLIITLALIRRDLNCKEEVAKLLNDYNLINLLYGGLIKLLDGKSETFKIEIHWNHNSFENKYEFIKRFPVPERWRFIDLILTTSILIKQDSKKFEKLLLKDSTNLLLLNFLHAEEGWVISREFIKVLLMNRTCELRRNAGFYLLLKPIERILAEGLDSKNSKKKFVEKINEFSVIFDEIPPDFKSEMLINYFLTNKRANRIPTFLAKEMMKAELVDYLVIEITSNKLRTLDDIYTILFIIKLIRIKSNGNKQYKDKLYNAVLKKLQEFIERNKGIYKWDANYEMIFREIYKRLPVKQKTRLESIIIKVRSTLMTCKLDELVRYNLFLVDKSRDEVLKGMLEIINREKVEGCK